MKKLLAALLLLPTLAFAGTKTIELNSNNTINFNQAFTAGFVAKKQVEAINLCYSNIGKEIFIVLYTPGGSISAGLLFFDTLKSLPCTFNTITIFSASMGYQAVQNLGKRYIIPSGTLMSHRASVSGLSGELGGELDTIINSIKSTVKELDVIASNRVGITLEKYRKDISDELWMTGEEAVASNHADEVVYVRCNKTLMRSYTKTINTLFGDLEVEFSECPIIVAPLSIGRGSNRAVLEYKRERLNMTKNIKTAL